MLPAPASLAQGLASRLGPTSAMGWENYPYVDNSSTTGELIHAKNILGDLVDLVLS